MSSADSSGHGGLRAGSEGYPLRGEDASHRRVPDEDRYWIAAGVGYAPLPWLNLDRGYTHIFIPDAEIDLAASDEGNTFRGNLSGEYEAHVDIVAVQGAVRF